MYLEGDRPPRSVQSCTLRHCRQPGTTESTGKTAPRTAQGRRGCVEAHGIRFALINTSPTIEVPFVLV